MLCSVKQVIHDQLNILCWNSRAGPHFATPSLSHQNTKTINNPNSINMKKQFLFVAAFVSFSLFSFGQTKAVFTQHLAAPENKIQIDPNISSIFLPSEGEGIQIEAHVILHNGNKETLAHLNRTGQYLLRLRPDGKQLKLTENSRRKKARVNDQPLRENVVYIISAPEHLFQPSSESDDDYSMNFGAYCF